MTRPCPHCNSKMEVFDESCPSCGGHSRPGIITGIVEVIYGHRSLIFLVAVLVAAWMILSRIIK